MPRNFFNQKPSSVALLIGALLVLLAILGTLQYRWMGRVSAGERELMQTNLRVKARGFCEEFDREITRAYAAFKMDADALRGDDRNSIYAERFDKWAKTSPHPGIIKNVFLAEKASGEGGRFNLSRFDEAKKRFEPIDWTPELESLRRDFEQQQNPDSASKKLFIGGADSIVEEIPALVGSIASVKITDAKSNRIETDWQQPLGHVIITLDFDYIKKEFFPALAKNYFVFGDAVDYSLTVISRSQPQKLIYQSNSESEDAENSSMAAQETAADASGKLFNISFSQVSSFSSERAFDAASTNPASNQAESDSTLVIPALKENKDDGDDSGKLLLVDDSARWELKVNHRLGSLDAAVEQARRWNLLVSFGILLLLAVSVIMIAVLSRRSQKLARRQIEFVAGVSHEFRNPLAVIHSLSENLAAGRIRDNRQVELYGATIHKDVRRLTEMVEQILEFAGAERGRHFYDKTPLVVGDLIEKVLAANVSSLQESGWSVEQSIESALPLVSADESALARALQNLFDNVIKYGNANKRLKIEVYKSADTRKPEVVIVVEDEGDGISATDLPHVFEPFYRAREAVDAQIHGSGLGLNLVKKIIEAHDGRVFVESADGRGSRFIIRLPAATPDEEFDPPNITRNL